MSSLMMTLPSRQKVLSFIIVVALAGAGVWYWRQSIIAKRAAWSATTLTEAMKEKDYLTARSTLTAIPDPGVREAKEQEIRVAELGDAIEKRDGAMIQQASAQVAKVPFSPELLEKADLVLAREALWNRNVDDCSKLLEKWQGKAAFPTQWTMVHADQLMAQGKKEEARILLEGAKLEGMDDAFRQTRLALLHAREPWKAMEVIDEGLRKHPRSAELLSFRAQIQEAAGRMADARLDYVAAILSDPASALHRDVFANFQLRMGELANAADTWRDAAEVTQVGIFAFKAWFWSKVGGVPLSRPLPALVQEDWKNVMQEIGKLQNGAYVSTALEQKMAAISGLRQRPEVRWMNLLDAMRRADWRSALDNVDLGFPAAAERMVPGLATRLFVNLRAISGGSAREGLVGRELPPLLQDPHPFLREFDQWKASAAAQDEEFTQWIATPASLAGTLFAHGWQGAALDVAGDVKLTAPTAAPDWFDFGYARCLIMRDGAAAARKWLESLPKLSTAAQLTLGEVLLTTGAVEKGMQQLAAIAIAKSPLAGRAAWTLALAELDRGNAAEASSWVKGNEELLASVSGKEILARCALAIDSRDEALRIYRDLGESSTDAMIYLSKDAFAKKDWPQARAWTEKLARRFPNEAQFRKNLLRIDADEAKKP